MKNKRGQGLSLNTIIIAAVALIVLVVLVMIFTGRMGAFTGGVNKCVNQGGACKSQTFCDAAPKGTVITGATGCTGTDVCCVKT